MSCLCLPLLLFLRSQRTAASTAVYGLMTPAEHSTYTGDRPGVRDQLQRPLSETAEAAASRYTASLSNCLPELRCSPPPPMPHRPASVLPQPPVLNGALVGAAALAPPPLRLAVPREPAPRRQTPVLTRRLPRLRQPRPPPWPLRAPRPLDTCRVLLLRRPRTRRRRDS